MRRRMQFETSFVRLNLNLCSQIGYLPETRVIISRSPKDFASEWLEITLESIFLCVTRRRCLASSFVPTFGENNVNGLGMGHITQHKQETRSNI